MLFTTYAFLFGFLPIVLLGWWSLRPRGVRLAFLTGASWVFYAWWDWRFLPLMVGTTSVDFIAALAIARSSDARWRRILLAVSLSVNLGILFYFKYTTFFLTSLNGLGALVGLDAPLPVLRVLLPIGISFYTFNSMSYTIDVFLRRVEPTRNILEYTTFVALFPHLIAGPIVRFTDIAHTLRRPALRLELVPRDRRALLPRLRTGQEAAHRGSARSVCRPPVRGARPAGPSRRLGGGRRLHAPALLRLLRLLRHGGRPRTAARIPLPPELQLATQGPEHRRLLEALAHDSVRWLRDYLYIPLGGSRHGLSRTALALGVTMFLGGLWHGAASTFVVWGIIQGTVLAGHAVLRNAGLTPRSVALNRALTFMVIAAAFVVFRSPDLGVAGSILLAMTGLHGVEERRRCCPSSFSSSSLSCWSS